MKAIKQLQVHNKISTVKRASSNANSIYVIEKKEKIQYNLLQ